MGKRTKWGRRRGDNRGESKVDYALIQDTAETGERNDFDSSSEIDETLVIPQFEPMPTENEAFSFKKTAPADTPTSQKHPQIFALVGATGGVGTTSIATQLAHEFAITAEPNNFTRRRPSDPTVCLIDLDFESGACAHHLDLLPSLSLDDLCGPADQIDKAFTQALVSTHECGVSLLAAPNTIGANARVNPETVMAMLDAAAELYDTVIIDLPRYEQPWTQSVMRAVDVLGLTCELTIPSLHSARERLTRFSNSPHGSINTHVILSKFERRSFKNTLRLNDAETAVGQPIIATMCLDPDSTREALNCGEPVGAIRPESRFVKDVRKLSEALCGTQTSLLAKTA